MLSLHKQGTEPSTPPLTPVKDEKITIGETENVETQEQVKEEKSTPAESETAKDNNTAEEDKESNSSASVSDANLKLLKGEDSSAEVS